jgi:hypothetical protein
MDDTRAVLVEEDFRPQSADEPVIFHFRLPTRFVPCPDREPLITPSRPWIAVNDEQLAVTFVADGSAEARFWIRQLSQDEAVSDFQLTNLFDRPAQLKMKTSLEVNFGILKFVFSGPNSS